MKPVNYDKINTSERKIVRENYVIHQQGLCYHCLSDLRYPPPDFITEKKIQWDLFPKGFLKNPVHLHHNHDTSMTIGAVHAYCNAVLWLYYGE